MTKDDKTKRSFFKKLAATLGFVSGAGYIGNLISGSTNSIQVINDNSAHEANRQKKVWLQKQWVPMTDEEKKQMLDEILGIDDKYNT
jgi:hypothetical protein